MSTESMIMVPLDGSIILNSANSNCEEEEPSDGGNVTGEQYLRKISQRLCDHRHQSSRGASITR